MTIVWIDDLARAEASSGLKDCLRSIDPRLEVTTNPEAFLKSVDPAGIAVIDYHLDGTDGITVAERLLASYPGTRILFLSEYLAQFNPNDKIDPRAVFEVVEKPTGDLAAWCTGQLRPAIQALLERTSEPWIPRPDGAAPANIQIDPTELDEYSFEDQMSVVEACQEYAREFASDLFVSSSAQWALLVAPSLTLVRWGPMDSPYPSENVRREIEGTFHEVSFLVTRPIEVEEIDGAVNVRGAWSSCKGIGAAMPSTTDVYPSLAVELWGWRADIHLDTGSPYSFLSFEDLTDAGLGGRLPRGRFAWTPELLRIGPEQNEERIRSAMLDETVQVDSLDGTVDIVLSAKVINPWRKSGLARTCTRGQCTGSEVIGGGQPGYWCGNRKGLLGRNILRSNRIALVLDSAMGRTYVLRPGSDSANPASLSAGVPAPDDWERFSIG